jgi:PAS domain S-box-containing protein
VWSRETAEETQQRSIRLSDATLAFAEAATDLPGLLDIIATRVAEALEATCRVELGDSRNSRDDLVVPLHARNRAIGQLVLGRGAAFDAHDLAIARLLADHAAVAISNAQLLATPIESKRLAERFEILAGASREFSSATADYHGLLEVVARRLGESVGDMCAIRAVTEDGEWLESSGGVFHRDPALLDATRALMSSGRQRVGEGLSGRVAASGKPLVTTYVDPADFAASSAPEYRPYLERLAVTSCIMLPLICRDRVVGVANLMRGKPYDDDDVRFAQSVADHAASAIANARSYAAEYAARERAEQAAVAMAMAESRFAQLFDSALIGMLANSIDGRVIDVNDALVGIVGYSRDELLSGAVSWRDLTPEEWRGVDTKATEQLIATGIGELREKEYIHKTGRRVPVLVGSVMLAGTSNECISFVLDLTERKDAQAAIDQLRRERSADLTFRGLLESAPDAMVIANRDGAITFVNGQVERLFGYARDEVIGQPIEILIPERHRHSHPAQLAGYFRQPTIRRMGLGLELFGRRKDGSEFPIEVSLSPVETAAGLLVSSAIRDITERTKAEQQRAQLAAIVDASADAIIGKTLLGIVTSWNPGARRLFGYAADEIVGSSISLLVPAGREDEEASILAALATGETKQFDTIRRRKDGRIIDVSVTTSPIRNPAGQVIGISKVARDITDRKRSEDALAHAKDAAVAASSELEAFSYSVAHDLRAPLRGMNGFASLLLETYGDKFDAEGVEWLNDILLNAKRMADLIDALLSLSRVARSELNSESVDLSSIVHALVARLAADEPARVVELVVHDQVRADLDRRLAGALIENLVRNAWKFTSKLEVARIEFGTCEADGGRAFYVRDNGVGFDMAYASRLFSPFQRLHAATEFPGTGIGLATVQRIIHRHGGRIWAEGAVNGGATFYFSLPNARTNEVS